MFNTHATVSKVVYIYLSMELGELIYIYYVLNLESSQVKLLQGFTVRMLSLIGRVAAS